jgi:hypothetical protein
VVERYGYTVRFRDLGDGVCGCCGAPIAGVAMRPAR